MPSDLPSPFLGPMMSQTADEQNSPGSSSTARPFRCLAAPARGHPKMTCIVTESRIHAGSSPSNLSQQAIRAIMANLHPAGRGVHSTSLALDAGAAEGPPRRPPRGPQCLPQGTDPVAVDVVTVLPAAGKLARSEWKALARSERRTAARREKLHVGTTSVRRKPRVGLA